MKPWIRGCLALAITLGGLAGPRAHADPGGLPIDLGTDCGLTSVPDLDFDQTDPQKTLRIAVVLDGVTESAAAALLARAEGPYRQGPGTPDPLRPGVQFQIVSYEPHSFENTNLTDPSKPTLMDDLIAYYQNAHGSGGRDLVHLFTSKDISKDNGGVVGLTNCIGAAGIRPDLAYTLSQVTGTEAWTLFDSGIGPTFWPDLDAKIAAHEIGHAMGAQHHYANCVEVPHSTDSGDVCTLMFNDVDVQALQFGTLEAAVVRGHAYFDLAPRPPT